MTLEVPLSGKRGAGLVALIDEADEDIITQYSWFISSEYAVRTHFPGYWRDGHYRVSMARTIVGLGRGDTEQVDHIDLNRLNNRRANLRICNNALNRQNVKANRGSSSSYRGVDYIAAKDKWRAQVGYCGRSFHIGLYATEVEAAVAAQDIRKKLMPFTIEQEIICP